MKHLADHRTPSTGARFAQFLRLTRNRGEIVWARVWQRPVLLPVTNRRVVEYIRIERGREI